MISKIVEKQKLGNQIKQENRKSRKLANVENQNMSEIGKSTKSYKVGNPKM